MSNVIEIEETLTEIQALPTYETAPSEPVERRGFRGKLCAALKRIASGRQDSCYADSGCYKASEMPTDILARQNPYLYIKALAG